MNKRYSNINSHGRRSAFSRFAHITLAGFAIALLSFISAPAYAQKPAAKAPAPKRPAADGSSKHIELPPAEDPVVEALLETKPTAPADIFKTARTLEQLGRPELAKGFLGKLLAANLDDAGWAALVEEFTSMAFTDLAVRSELSPEGDRVAAAALGAVNRRAEDPARIAAEIKQLGDASGAVRSAALAALQVGHATAVNALIGVLADPGRAAEHPVARAALAAMRGDAIDPLADLLQNADPALAVEAIRALAEMHASQATAYLYVPALADQSDAQVRDAARKALVALQGGVPSKPQASQQLGDLARDWLAGRLKPRVDFDDRATLWNRDAQARRCVARNCSAADASRAVAARLAHDAQILSPDNLALRTLSLAAAWEAAVYHSSLDKPLDFEKDPTLHAALAVDPKLVENVLTYGLQSEHYAAARVAADVLGRTGSSIQPLLGDAKPRPLVRAVRSPDRRLRLAALEAIARLTPKSSFSGASFVTESLGYLVATTGFRRALLVTPNDDSLQDWRSVLAAMHIQGDLAHSGREALRMAFRCPDYEIVLIDPAIQGPMADSIVEQLRQDYRTANLRVGIVARSGYGDFAERIARANSLTLAFSRPHDMQAARWQYGQLAELAPHEFVGFEERQSQAARALACLATLANTSKVFEISRLDEALATCMYASGLGGRAAAVLVNVGTPASQQELVDLASRVSQPIAVRNAASKAFHLSVAKFGLLLTEDAIRHQYERYDRSGSLDAATQELYASILDTIESQQSMAKTIATAKRAARSSKGASKSSKTIAAPPTTNH